MPISSSVDAPLVTLQAPRRSLRRRVRTLLSRTVLIAIAVTAASLPSARAQSLHVLLLGDGLSELDVQPALVGAGHLVTFGGIYYDWDGSSADLSTVNVIVICCYR